MKTKIFNKRLVLNKKTIADLSNTEMAEMYGGDTIQCATRSCTCVSCFAQILTECPLDCHATVTCTLTC
jgi:hypothetical protein